MKTLKKILVTVEFVKGDLPFKNLEFGKFYISKEKMKLTHMCLCGCTGFISIPISTLIVTDTDGGSFSGNSNAESCSWGVEVRDGKLTVTPSILNHPCECHYIVTNGIANIV